jgi:hypothetical protein
MREQTRQHDDTEIGVPNSPAAFGPSHERSWLATMLRRLHPGHQWPDVL